MLINIFDGIWNDGFVDLNTGELITDKNTWAYSAYPESVFSNLITIKKNVKYQYGFLDNNATIPENYRIRVYNADGSYRGNLMLDEFKISPSDMDCKIRVLFYLGLTKQ